MSFYVPIVQLVQPRRRMCQRSNDAVHECRHTGPFIIEAAGRVLVSTRHLLTGFSSRDVHHSTTCCLTSSLTDDAVDPRDAQSAHYRACRLCRDLGGGIRRLEAQTAKTPPRS